MFPIELREVTKTFQSAAVIRGVDLEVRPGELLVFVGPSGCGKSTLLRMIAGLESTTSGQIWIGGRDATHLPPYERQLSMVFQSYALYPHMSVWENMAFSLKTAGESPAQINAKVSQAAAMLKLEPYLQRKPKALSGGQRQRVAIGRALVRSPIAFLLDEPLSNLDAALRVETRMEIAKLHRELGAAMIYVTHDQTEAMTLADRIVVLNQGQIMQADTPQHLYERPANTFVAQFIGSPKMNLLTLEPSDRAEFLRLPGGKEAPCAFGDAREAHELGVRPEHLEPCAPQDGWLRGQVSHVEYLGSETCIYVSGVQKAMLCVRVAGRSNWAAEQAIGLRWQPHQQHVFNASGLSLLQA